METNTTRRADLIEIGSRLADRAKVFAGKRILITGAGGFLGKYFVSLFDFLNSEVLEKPCAVIGLDNFIVHPGAAPPQNTEHFAFVRHDVIKPFYPERPVDFVIHAAGIASPYYYRKYPLETLEVATTGLRNVLELARNHTGSRVLFFSSSEIYGDPDPKHVPIKESYRGNVACLGARACYDEGKRLGETLVRIYWEQFGVRGVIVRPFNVYGPGMLERDYRVMPNFVARALADKPVEVYGHGNQTRTFCYVTDAMVGFVLALIDGSSAEAYNIGNPSPEISMLDLARRIGHVIRRDVLIHRVEYPDSYPADEPQRRCPDITKAMLQLTYEPRVALDEGLARFIDWARYYYREH